MFLTKKSAFAVACLVLISGLPAVRSMPTLEWQGCYNTKIDMKDYGPYQYQSSGHCQGTCYNNSMPVMALWRGSHCLCGGELPPKSANVSDDKCSTPCIGYDKEKCGGRDYYGVYLSGIDDDPPIYSSTSEPSSHASTSPGGETVVVGSSDSNKKSHKNTAAIAAGSVVGSVAFLAICGGLFFLYRYKKRKAVEAEYQRSASMNNYSRSMGPIPMSDSRFDGSFLAQRRQSNGSIDDDQDFSRRILQVTNPDR